MSLESLGVKRPRVVAALSLGLAWVTLAASSFSWAQPFMLPSVALAAVLTFALLVWPQLLRRRAAALGLYVVTAVNGVWLVLVGFSHWSNRRQPETHVLPNGYRGWVLIAFEQPHGVAPKRERGRAVYNIPASGVLLTQAHPNTGRSSEADHFVFEQQGSTPEIHEPKHGTFAAGESCSFTFQSYWVGPAVDKATQPEPDLQRACTAN